MNRFFIVLTVLLALTLGSNAMFEGGFGGYGYGHGLGGYYGYGYPGFGNGFGYGGWGPWKHRKAARKHHKKNH
ncbi:hypothetical protein Y032_0439g1483 [Ancylostoma ceylanicum]|uniref:Neuropeptide-like protein 31 family protein n=1 Tax=Ancylostoma ceylanicum TaxID=53326 RepID=A0A016X1G0_9BILA|nr:hypothetical protein Y032_0439g1483 [Ancylostoma ceylanicum]